MTWLLLLAFAIADEPPPPPVIDIYANEEQAWADLHRALRAMGFRQPVRRGDRVIYHNQVSWKPSVHLFHDGRVEVHRAPARIGPPGEGPWGSGGNSVCLGIPSGSQNADESVAPGPVPVKPSVVPAACLHLDGLLVSNRRVHGQEAKVFESVGELAFAWSSAVATRSWSTRMREEVPARVRALWEEAPSPAEGKEALVELWCTRLDTPEGQDVRAIVEDFLTEVVQPSDVALTADELADIEARCGRELRVGP